MSFLTPIFLAGTAAALIPILLHLLHRRRVREVTFGSLRFLRNMPQRVVRRRRLEEILLILVRALALVALALAFARPLFWKPENRAGTQSFPGEGVVLLAIDNSWSMRADDRLTRAKKEARDILKRIEPTTKVGIATFSSEFALVRPVDANPAEAARAIDAIEPSWQGTDLAVALEQADRALSQRPEEYRQLIVISDFSQSAWKKRADWRLSPGIELVTRNVGEKEIPNIAIERMGVPPIVVAGGFVEVISARIRNLTDKALNNVPVTFRVGDKVVEKKNVNLAARSDAPVRFRYAFAKPGDVAGSIQVEANDEVKDDNRGFFSVHVTPRIRLLLVNGDPNEALPRNDGFFLKTALVPQTESGEMSPFQVREETPATIGPESFKATDAVILANVEQLSDKSVAALRKLVAAGGGVAFLCGAKIRPAEFNKAFEGLAPCRLWKTAMQETDAPVVISQIDMGHEIFLPFAGPHTGDLATGLFRQYFLLQGTQLAKVLARLSDSHPILVEGVIGEGRTLLFASALDLEWNDLCLKSVFVPFVHQLARRLCAREMTSARNLFVGERTTFRVPTGTKSAEWRLPDGQKEKIEPQTAGEASVVAFAPKEPGVYELAWGNEVARFAVNLDVREPDFRPLDMKLFVNSVQSAPVIEGKRRPGATSIIARSSAREKIEARQRLWMYAVAAVLALLAAEMTLARRVGTA